MTTLKVWGGFLALVVAAVLGTHIYTVYVVNMPHVVWRFAGTVWASWATWHTFRLATR
jgi:hypothetical protein